ncbi:MAG: glutamate-1-semialdehyde 2,1-aminomutase [Acidobacteriota bacterium]
MKARSNGTGSARWMAAAREVIPGGVNSPVRAFVAVGGEPFVVDRGEGCRLHDVDGNVYVDYVGSWGPLILGHAHPQVLEAIAAAAARGTSYGAPSIGEVKLAREITRLLPSVEKVRLVNSGTEATMSAIRLARGATGRNGVVKCEGCYHGHVDALLVAAGSGAATLGVPSSSGVPGSVVEQTFIVPFNDAPALARVLDAHGEEIACVIVEPVAGNMGCVPPGETYLDDVRRLTRKHGVLLILDEVMTGFRVAAGGAQERFGIEADLTTLGKIVGGGLPVGAYGGPADLMNHIAPDGPVYQAGTLSGNPLAVAAGQATLDVLAAGRRQGRDPYERLERAGARLAAGLAEAAARAGVPIRVNRVGSMWTVFFTAKPVVDFASASAADPDRFGRYFRGMLDRGIFLPPSPFETCFISLAHTDADIDRTIEAAGDVFSGLE